VNGHIDDTLESQAAWRASHPTHNLGVNSCDVAREAGADFAAPKVGRGAASADIDLDGDPDVLITTNGGAAYLYRNDSGAPDRSVRLTLRGMRSNRDGIGTVIRARVGSGDITRVVRTGSSYLSQSELPVTIGLAGSRSLDRVVVEWPSGTRDAIGALAAGKAYTVTEGRGITAERPLTR
jgi:hypothetical protein